MVRVVNFDNLETLQCWAPSSYVRGTAERPLANVRHVVAVTDRCFWDVKFRQHDIVRKASQNARPMACSFRGEAFPRLVIRLALMSGETTVSVSTSFRMSTSRFMPRDEEWIFDESWVTAFIIVGMEWRWIGRGRDMGSEIGQL